jgi:hypothetical protein
MTNEIDELDELDEIDEITKMPTEKKYRRLDMANLPPYNLKRCGPTEPHWKSIFSPIRYKNVWNYEEEARNVEEKQKTDLARQNEYPVPTKKKSKIQRPFCKFCMHRGLPLKDCKTHYIKSGPQIGAEITCPVLLTQQCARCGEIGHTPKYCRSPVWLKTDPCQISSYRDPYSIDWFHLRQLDDSNIYIWQKPIPPALQKRHQEYEELQVKSSRIWIEMTGDHTKYTNDFRITMAIRNKDDWFHITPRTEYENFVQTHYEWMRTVTWDETPNPNDGVFFFADVEEPIEEPIVSKKTQFDQPTRQVISDIIKKYTVPKET